MMNDFDCVLDITQIDVKQEVTSMNECNELIPIAQINFVRSNESETELKDDFKYKVDSPVVSLTKLDPKNLLRYTADKPHCTENGDDYGTELEKKKDSTVDKKSLKRDKKGRFICPKSEISCNQCDRTFNKLVAFREHRKVHRHKTTFECAECGKVFVEKIKLTFHQQVDHIKFPCSMCSLKFDSRKCLMSHLMLKHYDRTMYNCTKCRKTFRTKGRLRLHMESVHSKEKKENVCQEGEKYLYPSLDPKSDDDSHFDSIEYNKEMVKEEIVSNIHEVPIVSTPVKVDEDVKDEYKIKVESSIPIKVIYNLRDEKGKFLPNKSIYKCEKCEQSFRTVREFKIHWKTHKVHECDLCKETFTKISLLRLHIKKIHDIEYTCNDCNKVFINKRNLKSHIERIHLISSKIYTCKICKKTFSCRAYLKIHASVHKILKPFKCNVCLKAFTQSGTLKAHKLQHTGSKPYKCNICEKKFSHINYLKTHEIIHDKKKQFQCDKCGKAFTQVGTLKYHKIIHSGLKPFQCELCGTSFAHPNYLKTHMKVHNNKIKKKRINKKKN